MMRTKKQQSNPTQPSFSMGFKESIFLSAILGWASPTYILGSLLKSQKSNTDLLYILSTIGIGIFSLIFLFDISSSILKLGFCLSLISFLVVFDCDRHKFFDNATIHFCNSIFLGLACYFVAMDLYPEIFTKPIQDLLSKINTSIPTAFTMLILCLIFQNIGYYLIWEIFSNSSSNCFFSSKSLTNANFIRNSNHQIVLFAILMSFFITTMT